MTLELYHWEPTVNSGELLICLHEKRVAFTGRYVDVLAFEQHSPQFLQLNARGGVPVLVHDGYVLTETTLILEYLDGAFPQNPLVPVEPLDRYSMRVWTKCANDYCAPALTLLGWHERMAPKLERTDRAAIDSRLKDLPLDRQIVWQTALDDSYTDEQLARADQHLEVITRRMEETLGSAEWLAGAGYSLADIALYPAARALRALRPQLINSVATPGLDAWLERMSARPAVQSALNTCRSTAPEAMFAPGPELGRWG